MLGSRRSAAPILAFSAFAYACPTGTSSQPWTVLNPLAAKASSSPAGAVENGKRTCNATVGGASHASPWSGASSRVSLHLGQVRVTPSASFPQGQGGGGSGGGGTGGGTIYFINGATGGFSTNYTWSMDSDGSNTTQLQWYGYFTYPSRALHNGHRWFLSIRPITGSYYGDGTTLRSEVFAYRADFDAVHNNNTDTLVQLTNDATLQPIWQMWRGAEWRPGDEIISFKARRWFGSTPVEGGLYTAALAYRADGNIIGLIAPPTQPALAFPLDSSWMPSFSTHSWDPTGMKVVYTDNPITGLFVADMSNSTRTKIFSGLSQFPDWSPDGTKIAFHMSSRIYTVKPNGQMLKDVIKPTYVDNAYVSGFLHPYFSATGSHITCMGVTGGTDDVFRATSSGGSLTNLTRTPSLNEIAVGWR